ncbi:somatostatin receptor type 4-like [Patiria miniata]|uniref:G-protein coupled receptors family 1 profile domain-containing protein n=1 Tax=Patiria miniata TaxID=46514 RepID=A0A913Z4N5_PATMI|nr:somatostatin receptor type 4-like [Patiria miniata]
MDDTTHWPNVSVNCSQGNWTTENCTDDYGPSEDFKDWGGIVAGVFLLIVCVMGLIGNSMVIFVVLRYAKMKTVTNSYILNLAIADDLFMIALVFLSIATLAGNNWVFGPVMCHVVYAIDGLNMFTSVFCLTAMSMDRYVAVCHARRVRGYRTLRLATCVNIGVWFLALAAASPMNIVLRYDPEDLACHFNFNAVFGDDYYAVDLTQKLFMIYTSLMGFVIPLFIICVCYSSIVMRLRKIGARTGKMKKSKKVNRLVFFVVLAFFMCWWPFYVWRTVVVFVPSIRQHWHNSILMSDFTMCLSYLNSCANPLLYGFLSGNFKKSFKKVWSCSKEEVLNGPVTRRTPTPAQPM